MGTHPWRGSDRLVAPATPNRRSVIGLLAGLPMCAVRADNRPAAGRKLDFQVGEGFGEADAADIRAVLKSTGESIWQHCPNTRWETAGFFIYHTPDSPITDYEHRADGRVQIGLTPRGNYWDVFAFEFAHEFCHALATHANDWRQCWRVGRRANNWFEESLCETASLFALRSLGRSWAEQPPYPNWRSYARAQPVCPAAAGRDSRRAPAGLRVCEVVRRAGVRPAQELNLA